MLLSRKHVFKNNTGNMEILRHMGYSAYKLWNVGNYEKRNYEKLGMDKYPNWYEQKKRLKSNFFYENLPSQTAQDVLQLLEEGWKSFFKLLKTGGVVNPQPPRFKKKVMDITFLKDAIKQDGDISRLTIPKQLKKYLKSIGLDATFIYLETDRFSDIQIKELQIKFIDEETFAAIAVYEQEVIDLKKSNGHYLSIDLGINNTFTCYDSTGAAFILKGFLNATHYCDKKIAHYQSITAKKQAIRGIKYPKSSKRVLKLYEKRKNKVRDYLHKSTRHIADYCRENKINKVVIGDIKGIREDNNLGRNNQQMHSLPYNQIYSLLEYKLRLYGIEMVKQKEYYTSKCSPNSEDVSRKYACASNRKRRGLYVDGDNIYNADCVGAYNILRLFLKNTNKDHMDYGNLCSPVNVTV
jgi:putative transposase